MKNEDMTLRQKLYSQKIYQINQTIQEFKGICEIDKKQFINFSILDYYTRKFNSLAIDNRRWSFEEGGQEIENIKKCFLDSNHSEFWKDFFGHIEKDEIEAKNESLTYFKENVKPATMLKPDDFHFHLLNLYQSYSLDQDKNIDGVVFRNFKKFMKERKKLRYAIGEFLNEDQYKNTYNDYPWINMRFVFESANDDDVYTFSSQESAIDIPHTKNRDEKTKEIEKHSSNINKNERELYQNYIVPIIVGYRDPNSNDEKDLFNGCWYNKKGEKQYLLSSDKIKELIPQFKFWLFVYSCGSFYISLSIQVRIFNRRYSSSRNP